MRTRSLAIVALVALACTPATLLTKDELGAATCTGVGGAGSATIRCELGQLVPTQRLRIVEVGRDRIVLVGEKAEARQQRVAGLTTPLSLVDLPAGTYAIVLRAAGGELVTAGSVVVEAPRASEAVENAAGDVYGRQ